MVSIADFKLADGRMDWPRYNAARQVEIAAEVAAGKWCSRCGHYLLFAKGHPDKCYSCKQLDNSGEVTHHKYIRCPKCLRTFDPSDADYYSLYRDGDHDIACPDCSHSFLISTRTSYTFTSPAKLDPAVAEHEE